MTGVLVTGARGGLGGALLEILGGDGLHRGNADALLASGRRWEIVVHGAYSRAKDLTSTELPGYLSDTLDLTERALAVCGRVFVLASSISVYPLDGHPLTEDAPIPLDRVPGFYGLGKLLCEARALEWARRTGGTALVLRLSSLLGPRSPANVTARILRGLSDAVPLTGASRFNYVTHDEVGAVVRAALDGGLGGVMNVGAADRIELAEVARLAGRTVRFGAINYQAPQVPTDRARALVPQLARSSRERIEAMIASGRV